MGQIPTPPYLKISQELKNSIDCNNYHCLDNGSQEENILCAIFILFSTADMPIEPEQFLKIYIAMVKTLYIGLNISPELHPTAQDSKLANDVRSMKGIINNNLLKREVIKKIANFIIDGSISFESALDEIIIRQLGPLSATYAKLINKNKKQSQSARVY
ncbi:MAG: hypothetical protein WC621_00760 [Patescibacteria group bacterium]